MVELINQTCHTKLFSQNMEIHKRKILLNTKKLRCILCTNKNSLKILKEDEYRLLKNFKEVCYKHNINQHDFLLQI